MLEARNISKSYREGGGKKLEVLKDISLSVSEGEIISITGESGVGKTTLLHILGLLDKPDTGEIFLDGTPISSFSENTLAKTRNSRIGFVFQFHYLIPEFTALENVAMPARLAGIPPGTALKRARYLLGDVGVFERAAHFPNALSGGEQQRVALARALVCEPNILLADEPTGNLDEKNANKLIDILFGLAKTRNLSVIIATHNRELAGKAEKRFLLANGVIAKLKYIL